MSRCTNQFKANRTRRAHALKLNLSKLLVVTNNWGCMFGKYQCFFFFLMVLANINVEKGEPKAVSINAQKAMQNC